MYPNNQPQISALSNATVLQVLNQTFTNQLQKNLKVIFDMRPNIKNSNMAKKPDKIEEKTSKDSNGVGRAKPNSRSLSLPKRYEKIHQRSSKDFSKIRSFISRPGTTRFTTTTNSNSSKQKYGPEVKHKTVVLADGKKSKTSAILNKKNEQKVVVADGKKLKTSTIFERKNEQGVVFADGEKSNAETSAILDEKNEQEVVLADGEKSKTSTIFERKNEQRVVFADGEKSNAKISAILNKKNEQKVVFADGEKSNARTPAILEKKNEQKEVNGRLELRKQKLQAIEEKRKPQAVEEIPTVFDVKSNSLSSELQQDSGNASKKEAAKEANITAANEETAEKSGANAKCKKSNKGADKEANVHTAIGETGKKNVLQVSKPNKNATVKNLTNEVPACCSEPTTNHENLRMVTQELPKMVTNFKKPTASLPIKEELLEHLSTLIQVKKKEFFKTSLQNRNSCIISRVQNDVVNNIPIKKQPICTNVNSNSGSVRDNVPSDSSSYLGKFAPCNNRSRENILKQLKEEVQRAISNRKTFTITGRRYLFPLRKALLDRGWIEKFHSTYKSHLPIYLKKLLCATPREILASTRPEELTIGHYHLIKSKLLDAHQVDFYWGYGKEPFNTNPDNVKLTVINRLKKDIFNYASKEGLRMANETSYWFQEFNISKLYHPRTYALNSGEEIRDFVEDFRQTAVMSLLKWIVKMHETQECRIVSNTGKVPLEAFEFAINESSKMIKVKKHEDIDLPIAAATEYEWNHFLDFFYKIVHYSNHFKSKGNLTEESLVGKSSYVLNRLKEFYQFLDMDGMMNLWILKPSYCSMGRGIHMCNSLEYVLGIIRENTHTRYIVQKYIERPLLIYNTKFDIRQWFLISSCSPLTIWMYKESYLRFSSQTYNLRKLHESVHLTNNSIQSKYKTTSLDSVLPNYNMWDSTEFKNYLSNIGYANAFKDIIYPGMKQSIVASILIHQDKMAARKNCFELYGADFMVTEDFQPWLLEINSAPALYGSTPVTARMCPKVQADLVKVMVDHVRNNKAPTGSFEMIYKQRSTKVTENICLEVTGLPLQPSYFRSSPVEKEVIGSLKEESPSGWSVKPRDFSKSSKKDTKRASSSGPSLQTKNVSRRPKEDMKSVSELPYEDSITVLEKTHQTMRSFSQDVRKTLKHLLKIIQFEKKKRGILEQNENLEI